MTIIARLLSLTAKSNRMKLLSFVSIITVFSIFSSEFSVAQEQAPSDANISPSSNELNLDRKQLEISRTNLKPVLDGILDDEIWQGATVIKDLHQTQPLDHGEVSELSEFYVTYDDNYFYVAARLYDSQVDDIRARQMVQGQPVFRDDFIRVTLDTFNNGRTAFAFLTNPNGVRSEAVFEGPTQMNFDWSGIWDVRSAMDDLGWTAEMAIPFTTLNFDPATDVWGFDVFRRIQRTNESISWSSFNRQSNPSTAGQVSGIRDIKQGLGLDVIPSFTVAEAKYHTINQSNTRYDPTLDVFYKFTPNLTGALTINTDFSATEADNQQVNFTRFNLFFPEKRDFFLQDSEIFSFGNGAGRNSSQLSAIAFYSRRIGIDSSSGQPVGIDAGEKVAGRIGDVNVGLLAVQQADREGLDGQNLVVGRINKNILGESRIGGMYTSGDPNSSNKSTLAGLDFFYRKTRFNDTHSLTSDWWYQETDVEGVSGDTKAYSANVELQTQGSGFSPRFYYNYIGNEYTPRLGFVRRRGIEQYEGRLTYRLFLKDHPVIRSWQSFGRHTITDSSVTGDLETESSFWRALSINTHQGDTINFDFRYEHDIPFQDFSILGLPILAGEYTYARAGFEFEGGNTRTFAPNFRYETGPFYDGDRDEISGGFRWFPNRRLTLNLSYSYNDVDLPVGRAINRQITLDSSVAITTQWSWLALLQYVSSTGTVGINSRLNWNPRAGEDFFFVLNYNLDSLEGAFQGLSTTRSEIILKYTKNFRF